MGFNVLKALVCICCNK